MRRQLKHRKRRRERNLCGWEGCPEVTGEAYYCAAHNEKQNARRRKKPEAPTPENEAA
jgi:hypothetical protein